MELVYKTLPPDHTIIATSCWHSGSYNCHKEGIRELVAKVRYSPNYFMVHHGDLTECITPNDKRYCQASVDVTLLTPGKQRDWLVETLTPIGNKVLSVMLGNHDYGVINIMNVASDVAKAIGAPYGGLMCKLAVTKEGVNEVAYKWMMMHGSKLLPKGAKDAIQRRGNREAALKRILEETGHCDCLIMTQGHDHSALFVVEPTITNDVSLIDDGESFKNYKHPAPPQNSKYIPPEARWYGICGSMRKGITPPGLGILDYAELKGYGPAPLGWLEVKVENYEVVNIEVVKV
jgi:hypothetical protein